MIGTSCNMLLDTVILSIEISDNGHRKNPFVVKEEKHDSAKCSNVKLE